MLGIDPGRHGGIVGLNENGEIVLSRVMPYGESQINFKAYVDILIPLVGHPIVAYVEEVHAIFGSAAKATFTFGRNYQATLDGLEICDIEVVGVKPKAWQTIVFQGMKQVFKKDKPTKVDTKTMALKCVNKHWPKEKFLATGRSKKSHEGLVDAACIAKYGLKQEQLKGVSK